MHDREKMFIIHWWSMYTVRHLATGFSATIPAARRRHFLMSFSSDLVASHVSLEDGTAFRGILGFCLFVWGDTSYLGTLCILWLSRPRCIAVRRLLWLIYHKSQSCFSPSRLFYVGSHVRFLLWPRRFLLRFPLCQFLCLSAESSAVSFHSVVGRAWFLLWLLSYVRKNSAE